jgi:outer membrane biosynthesis protein TonB
MKQACAATAAVVAILLGLIGFASPSFEVASLTYSSFVTLAQAESVDRTRPAIILGPPPGESTAESADEAEAEGPPRPLPPIARKKPQPPKKVSAPKAPQKKAATKKAPAKKAAAKKAPAKKPAAQKAPAKKAVAKAPVSPPQQAKDCDYCYGCEALVPTCKRQWVCGKRYTERLAAGLCRR